MGAKSIWGILKGTVNEFLEDRALRLSAATAYYAVFSIGPLLVLIVGVAGLAMGRDEVHRMVTEQVESFVGQQSAQMIESMMSAQQKSGSLMATIIGGVALVLGASGVFGQLQDSLNTIWGVTTKPGQSIGAFIRDRLFSLAMVLSIGFLLLVSMALSMLINGFAHLIGRLISLPDWVPPVFNEAVSFVVTSLLFALIFKVLPDVKIRWRDVAVGAMGTALLFTAGKFLLGFYLSHEMDASAYGTGSAFVVILLYVYYSSLILYLGAEFTQVYARHHGVRIQPSKYAIHMTDEERAHQGMPRKEQIEQAAARQQAAAATAPKQVPIATTPALPTIRKPPYEPIAATRPRYSPSKGTVMASSPHVKTVTRIASRRLSPGERVTSEPWAFVTMALAFGLAAGWLWRFKTVRRALRTYMLVRKIV